MKQILFLVLGIIISSTLIAQDDFEQFRQQELQSFQNYSMQQDSLFIQYKDQVEKEWNEFVESTPSEWVTYSEDFKGRSQVDFEEGSVKVEAVVDNDDPQSKEKAKEIVKEQLTKILEEKDSNNKPVIADQIEVKGIGEVTKNNIEEAVDKIVEKGTTSETTGNDNTKKTRFTIVLDLVPDHIQVRINKYKPTIEKLCDKYDIDPKVALAIIHTESFYNPNAYNRHGNAYGMMQIVPKYAGLTMNNALFRKNYPPSSSDLYNPERNLEMGIGYMRWLADNKWGEVTNNDNLYYCIICSYNGGTGSVYKAMIGKMNGIKDPEWDNMISSLNSMSKRDLFNKLKRDIPWEETRKYIQLVQDRIDKYYKNI